MVDVSEEEVVNGAIPVASELVPGGGIPPVGVEAAVGEHCQFGEDIELGGIKVSVNGVDKHYLEWQIGNAIYITGQA